MQTNMIFRRASVFFVFSWYVYFSIFTKCPEIYIYQRRSIKMRLAVVEICVTSLEKFFMIESGSFYSENVLSLPPPSNETSVRTTSQVAPRVSVPAYATTIMLHNGDQYRSNRVGFHRLIEGELTRKHFNFD